MEAPSTVDDTLETRGRSRIVAAVGLALSLLCIAQVPVFYQKHPALAALCAVAALPHLIAAVLARRTRRYVVPATVMVLTFFIGNAASGWLQGEAWKVFLATNLLFPTVVPQGTALLLGARSGIAMGVATIAYLTATFVWLALHPASAGVPLLGLKYLIACGAITIGLTLSILYTRMRAHTVAELRAAHAALGAVRLAEQRRLNEEIDLAARIQTALLPSDLAVEGLEIATVMLPAAEVGGDYYDVIPVEGGAWLCIGDVAGHGLNAGLTMLMIQSAVSALAQDNPALRPGEVLSALNTTLYQNIRQRMGRDEHATLTLLRYHGDGTVCYAGAHEEILVLRVAGAHCEMIATPGPWVGARSSIAGQVVESRLSLDDGDLLVLYTDGLTEAMDGGRRQFGLERVEAEILRARGEPVEAIRDAILGAVHAFCPVLADDVALLVARYHKPALA